ncbi:very long chain fatty acid elongase AAEL008004 [Drosophila tropicalis]|uniref:very long chain fatty acid elongase AAEL008004 n=1 Tax=Drosophila tropicalis TaxID=46794 RepID=UPI0035AC0B6B
MDATTATMSPVIEHPYLMNTPWFMLGTLALYLYIVTDLGPNFMEHRKPYTLKKLIICHNIIQVVSCIYVIYEILFVTHGNILYFWKCSGPIHEPEIVTRHFRLAQFLFWLKLSELIETVIFVLRKKQNQVSKLHVFHHIATLTLIYCLLHYNENGTAAFYPVFLNSMVHIIMYSYYLVAAVADKKVIRALTPVKKSITVIQMVQFFFILLQAVIQSIRCGVPKVVFTYFVIVVGLMFYGFYDFYNNSYKKSQRRKSLTSEK